MVKRKAGDGVATRMSPRDLPRYAPEALARFVTGGLLAALGVVPASAGATIVSTSGADFHALNSTDQALLTYGVDGVTNANTTQVTI
jgi:hypothetical protein